MNILFFSGIQETSKSLKKKYVCVFKKLFSGRLNKVKSGRA